jgi:rubrerythrin
MNPEQLARLWESRFHKMLEMEKESLDFYRDLSKKDELLSAGPRLKEVLEEIIEDEDRHRVICNELIRIVNGKLKK